MAQGNGVDYFWSLPDGCISHILSLTSPKDACRSAAVSRGFRSAADSDTVWKRFLPADHRQIISRSNTPVAYSSKKQLYFRLCDSPILLDDGKMSFSLDSKSGKKCYMLGARELSIAWGDAPYYWKWTSHPLSRFSEVAELLSVCWLDIRGKIGTQILSPNTSYAAYLVFRLAESSYGFGSEKAYVRFVGEKDQNQAENEAGKAYLKSQSRQCNRRHGGRLPRERRDGWMETELGEFFNHQGGDDEVELRLIEIVHLNGKCGLIVEGMEVRPKENA